MFERFTGGARQAVVLAGEAARLFGHQCIGTEHLLVGLIEEGHGVAAEALTNLGFTADAVRDQIEVILGECDRESPEGHIPFTPRAKKTIEMSLREALQLGHGHIGTEHILLGLLRGGSTHPPNDGVAAQILVKHGVDLSTVRRTVIEVLSRRLSENEPPALAPVPERTTELTISGIPLSSLGALCDAITTVVPDLSIRMSRKVTVTMEERAAAVVEMYESYLRGVEASKKEPPEAESA